MKRTVTTLDVDRLKREAKRITRKEGIRLHKAQAQVAQRDGFRNWELLKRSTSANAEQRDRPKNEAQKPITDGSVESDLASLIKAKCLEFIRKLDEESVFRVCSNGSIWISLSDYEKGTLSKRSFAALGPVDDLAWSRIGHEDGMTPLLNMDRLAERFLLNSDDEDEDEDEEDDDDGDLFEPDLTQMRYSVEVGRAELIAIAERTVEDELDAVEVALQNRYAQD